MHCEKCKTRVGGCHLHANNADMLKSRDVAVASQSCMAATHAANGFFMLCMLGFLQAAKLQCTALQQITVVTVVHLAIMTCGMLSADMKCVQGQGALNHHI